jgi:hypothetical protein
MPQRGHVESDARSGQEPATDRSRARATATTLTGVLALLITAVVCALVAIVAPRPVEPSRLPALRLPASLVAAQLARDRALSARAPAGPEERALIALIAREGHAELAAESNLERLSSERAELVSAARTLYTRLGAEGTRAFVAALTERALAALRELKQTREEQELLGSFPRLLLRYGYVSERGVLLAPELSVRALYKARLNLITEHPMEHDLSPIELQAHAGWKALHAGALEPEHRANAARLFYESGGLDGAETYAIWLYQSGAHVRAATLLRREHERTGLVRLRNMALFALRP